MCLCTALIAIVYYLISPLECTAFSVSTLIPRGRVWSSVYSAHGDLQHMQRQQTWDDTLLEMESERLYGLGSREAELDSFASKLADDRLNIFPEYQREYVWKLDKASRLIATVLCNRYVPPIVLHEKRKGEFDVVDGKQRLTSLLGFYLNRSDAGPLPRHNQLLLDKLQRILPELRVLGKLDESYEKLNGLSFDDLTWERQRAFKSYSLTDVVIPFGTPKPDVFEVYDDINSGGEDLKPQQVRRAVYYGPYIKLLDDLAESCDDFQAIRDPTSCIPTGELILRAFAFRQRGDKYKPPLKRFLNQELDGTDDFDDKDDKEKQRVLGLLKEHSDEFTSVMKVSRAVFEDAAFRKPATAGSTSVKRWPKTVSLPLWDAGYSAVAELLREYQPVQFTEAKGQIQAVVSESFETGYFAEDTARVNAKSFLARKDEMKGLIRGAIEITAARDYRRAFDPSLRRPLFDGQDGKCGICEQRIDASRLGDGSYVQIDHIEPHSRGGSTIVSNAQLVHGECNRKKGARSKNQKKRRTRAI